jgi:hypothetical protein
MKNDIIDIFKNTNISNKNISDNNKEFFNNLVNLMDNKKHKKIKEAFVNFKDFKLSYRGIMHNRVRKFLDELNPSKKKPEDMRYGHNPEIIASHLVEGLYDEVAYKCKIELEHFFKEPNLTVFTITEELINGILYSPNTRVEWRNLLKQYQNIIWQDSFERLNSNNKLMVKWNNKIEEMENYLSLIKLGGII